MQYSVNSEQYLVKAVSHLLKVGARTLVSIRGVI